MSLSLSAFAFSVSMGEFGATAMISRADTPTLPYAIFRYLSQPGSLNYGQYGSFNGKPAAVIATFDSFLMPFSIAMIWFSFGIVPIPPQELGRPMPRSPADEATPGSRAPRPTRAHSKRRPS